MAKENLKEVMDDTVLTCIHVLNKNRKYEYVAEDKKKGSVESFTCSGCIDMNTTNPNKVLRFLRVVCKDCFVDNRTSRKKEKRFNMKTKTKLFVIALALVSLVSVQLVSANLSTIKTDFEKPNVQLEDGKIPDTVGHLNKQYQHEEFALLIKQEIEKAEIIRDSLIISPIKEK